MNNKTNNSINFDNYMKKFHEFNFLKNENEKIEKCTNLFEESKKISEPTGNEKYIFYYSLAELYFYESKKESIQYGFSNGLLFDIEKIQEEKNKDNLYKIIEYKKISFDNYKKCLDFIEKSDTKENYDRIKEGVRILSQELSIMFYLIEDEELFFLYGKYAVEFHSLNSIYIFLKYYCDKEDYENAKTYYYLMKNYESGELNNKYQDATLKTNGYSFYIKFLYDSGMYSDALEIAKEYKKYVISNDMIENKLKFTRPTNELMTKCQSFIEQPKGNDDNENVLLDYFDQETLNLMSDDNKIYILTSLNIYNYMKSAKMTMDYSAVLMPILKAIENIIFDIIAKKYHEFISKRRNNINPRDIKGFINQKDNAFIEKLEQLELGTALYLIGYKYPVTDELIIRRSFINFCNENNVKNSKGVIIELYKELDELRTKRNLVAHKNRVFEESVKECYDILLNNIKFINFLYTNFKFVFENEK